MTLEQRHGQITSLRCRPSSYDGFKRTAFGLGNQNNSSSSAQVQVKFCCKLMVEEEDNISIYITERVYLFM